MKKSILFTNKKAALLVALSLMTGMVGCSKSDFGAGNQASSANPQLSSGENPNAVIPNTSDDNLEVLTVAPLDGTVVVSGALPITVKGGKAPYKYQVISGNGSFTNGVFYAPSTPQVVTIEISDSSTDEDAIRTTVKVISQTEVAPPIGSVPPLAAVTCQGSFRVKLPGYIMYPYTPNKWRYGTLNVGIRSNGALLGNISDDMGAQGIMTVGGSCILNADKTVASIKFTNYVTGTHYYGLVKRNPVHGKLFMSGNFTTQDGRITDSWTASQ